MSNKLTKKDIERILPPMDKERAMEQTERYNEEFEKSKKEFEELLEKLSNILLEEELDDE